MLKLGILDVGGRIEDTFELAPLAERLGYHRYWVAEHQPQPSPVVIAGIVAGITERIRVGTAGILLHYHPPRRTAHDLLLLERVFEGRIDAGVCGGQVHDPRLLDDLEGIDVDTRYRAYSERVATFIGHLRDAEARAIDSGVRWPGAPERPPQIWSHGSSARSAELAARHGVGFGYALLFANSIDDPAAVNHYRAGFVPAKPDDRPTAVLAVAGVCARTTERARAIAARATGFHAHVAGDPATVTRALAALADRYGVDEIVFADLCGDLADRKDCYELLAST